MRPLASLAYRARLKWLLRNEYESLALRRWFARDFGVEVGLYSYGCFDRWRIPPRTRIGRYCSFAKSVRVVELNHPTDALTTHPFLYEPRWGISSRGQPAPEWLEIGDDVWISHNATILPGCKAIGRGAIVGAGAVVSRDVPPYAIVAGCPARIVRMRFPPELVAAIEASRWWTLDRHQLAAIGQRDPQVLHAPTVERLRALAAAPGARA